MVRGTTPTHTFGLPLLSTDVTECWITYAQAGDIVLNKTKSDLTWVNDTTAGTCTASFKMTQEETLSFDTGYSAEIQITVLTTDNDAMRSEIFEVDVDRILNNLEIEDPSEVSSS